MLISERRSAAPVLASTVLMALLASASSTRAQLDQSGNQIWGQFTPLIEGVAELADEFGTALATGDFNGDGRDDLAIGVPEESVGAVPRAGAVNVIYGTNDGLQATGDEIWTQDGPAVQGDPQQDGRFGRALAAGDFDNDGYDDLAIGSPGAEGSAGVVNVLYGGVSGLQTFGDQQWSQASTGILGVAEPLDQFGRALSACDFNFDGFDDLAIGAPGEDVGGTNGAGAVNVVYGSANGLIANENEIWTQDTPGVEGVAEPNDEFGNSLAAGDFDDDVACDLAVGVHFEDVESTGAANAGAVNVLYGRSSGLSAAANQIWHQDSPGVLGVAETNDGFGGALAASDLNGDGYDDLAIGAQGESVNGASGAGAVNILYGSVGRLTTAGNEIWHQGSAGVDGAVESGDNFGNALSIGDFDNDGNGDLAIGVRLESVNGIQGAGAVNVLYGSAGGLISASNQLWSQASPGLNGIAEPFDLFGESLASGDFDNDGRDDLAVGVPQEDLGGAPGSDEGAVNILYGS